MAIDLRDGAGSDRAGASPQGRARSSRARLVLFVDNDRLWLANLGEAPALEVTVEAAAVPKVRERLAELAAGTVSAYEQRCIPTAALPVGDVEVVLRWRDHADVVHDAGYLVHPDGVAPALGAEAVVAPVSAGTPRPDGRGRARRSPSAR